MGELWNEAAAMAVAAAAVAAVAVPVGAACGVLAHRWREPIVPRYRKGFARWDGFDAVFLYVVCVVLPVVVAQALVAGGAFRSLLGDELRIDRDALAAATGGAATPAVEAARFDYQNRGLTLTRLAALPLLAAAFAVWRRQANKERVRPVGEQGRRFAADIAAGVAAWLVLTPATLAVHFAVNAVSWELDVPPTEHALKFTRLATTADVLLFFAGACVAAPFVEEMAFRRVLVPWAARRLYRSWVLLGLAVVAAGGRGHSLAGPLAFVGVAAAGLFVLDRLRMRPAAAVLATGTLFAAIHASVWPTPIPLLVLGVSLGWLVLRTKTVTAAVVAHGLFNAVSAVFLLRQA